MSLERKQIAGLSVKSIDEQGNLEGYANKYGNIDSYGDIVIAGAFTLSMQQHMNNGTMPKMFWQHSADSPIGKWTEFEERPDGLFLRGKINLDTQRGREAHSDIKFGSIDGLSIGYYTKQSTFDPDSGVRYLKEVDLIEVSVVSIPANPISTVTGIKAGSRNSAADRDRIMSAIDNLVALLDDEDRELLFQGLDNQNDQSTLVLLVRAAEKSLRDAGWSRKQAKEAVSDKIELLNLFRNSLKPQNL